MYIRNRYDKNGEIIKSFDKIRVNDELKDFLDFLETHEDNPLCPIFDQNFVKICS